MAFAHPAGRRYRHRGACTGPLRPGRRRPTEDASLDRQRNETPASRRERRRAQRIADRRAERDRVSKRQRTPAWRTPTALVTEAAVLIGLVLLVVFVIRPGSGTGTPAGSGDLPLGLVRPPVTIPAGLEHDQSLGSPGAPVTVDVWADFQCPVCGALTRDVEPQVITNFVETGIVRLVAHDFAFIGSGHSPDESLDAAVAARCAAGQGHYWDYAEFLFWNQGQSENGGAFTRDRLLAMGDAVGLDRTAFQACLNDQSMRANVQAETAQGASMGIISTPTLYINGQKSVGLPTYEQLATAIRQAAGTASPGPVGSPVGSPAGASAGGGASAGASAGP